MSNSSYQPTPSTAALAAYGTASPTVLHAIVNANDKFLVYDWSNTYGGPWDGDNYIQATGMAVGAWVKNTVGNGSSGGGIIPLPTPTPTTLGGVNSSAAVAHQFLTQIGIDGSISKAQPSIVDSSVPSLASPITAGTIALTAAMYDVPCDSTAGNIILTVDVTLGSTSNIKTWHVYMVAGTNTIELRPSSGSSAYIINANNVGGAGYLDISVNGTTMHVFGIP